MGLIFFDFFLRFFENMLKSINEIWTIFKLINKLPKNYNFNTRCTAKRCSSYFWCNFLVTCWWVWKLSKFHWYFLAIFFKKSQAHLAQAHLELSEPNSKRDPFWFFNTESLGCGLHLRSLHQTVPNPWRLPFPKTDFLKHFKKKMFFWGFFWNVF